MSSHYFICYETSDGIDFADHLYNALCKYDDLPKPWLDTRYSSETEDWHEFIGQTIKTSEGLIFVATPNSTESKVCRVQWQHALVNLKPIIPIRFNAYSDLPFRLQPRTPIEFGASFDTGIENLIKRLRWLRTEEGLRETIELAIVDLKFALRSPSADKIALNDRIAQLQSQADSLHAKAKLISQATSVQNKHVFISYSHKDADMMQELKRILTKHDLKTWNDEKIKQGDSDWSKNIESAIEQAGCVIALLSPDAKISKWVGLELSYAEIHNIRVFPILLRGNDANAVPIRLISTQRTSLNINDDVETQLNGLIFDLQNYIQSIPKVEFSY